MTTPQQPNDSYSKPAYDGRLGYHKLLENYIMNISNAQIKGDYMQWYLLLDGFLTIVAPFIKPSDVEKCDSDIKKLNSFINVCSSMKQENNKNYVISVICGRLSKITKDLYMCSKHLLLPIKDDNSYSEYSTDIFMKESDL